MKKILSLLSLALAAALSAADTNPPVILTNEVKLTVGPSDGDIARLTGQLLMRQHYSKQKFDDAMSAKFLDRYLNSLDPQHIYFLKGDLAEFEKYRPLLDDLTMKSGDTTPGIVIFRRFLQRFDQQVAYSVELLKAGKFEFTSNERYTPDRRKLAPPKDMEEARTMWRDRLRYEYLQEKLNIGRPEEIVAALKEKLQKKKPAEIIASIQAGKKKAEELNRLAQEAAKTNRVDGESVAAPEKVRQTNDITRVLFGKVGDDKAEEIAVDIGARLAKEKLDVILDSVRAKLERDNAAEIVNTLLRRYARISRSFREFDGDDVLQLYLSALTRVYDPHTDYMGKSQFDTFSINMKLSLFGIGAVLRSEDGYCKIQELMPGGPALMSKKLKPNDKIIAVAQGGKEPVDCVEMKLNKIVEMIRGPKGTEVRLTVVPGDAPDSSTRKIVTLIRAEIKLEEQEAKSKVYDVPAAGGKTTRLGVINLPSFYADMDSRKAERKSTTSDVAKLVRKMKEENVDGIILDLRGNGGGSLEEAISLTGLFIKSGPVVQVKDPDGTIVVDADKDPSVLYSGPLIVLTSRFSASASEILAGALQDYGRALIVGDSTTHGKGTVQSLIQLGQLFQQYGVPFKNNPGALKLTIRKFYRANGSSTQKDGVTPDLILPSPNNYAEVGEASLENPLPHDVIPSADFEKVNLIQPYLAELKRRSEQRVAKEKDFDFVREEIERYKKMIADKSVSLNEAQRLKEKKEATDRDEKRKKELRARGEPKEKIYELTLKQVAQPGLTVYVAKTNDLAAATVAVPKATVGHAAASDEDGTELADDKTPAVDINLEEAKRILQDWIALAAKGGAIVGKKD
ncbi:MAG: carboxy terminal-processing peptidase [Verrucomicrobia bacterium]|nr:carboxy terminal-processing peptidase [Verrucomicrobiota bacterium]